MEYAVVQESNVKNLVAEVNALIASGWRPLGGITLKPYDPGVGMGNHTPMQYMQPMTREKT